MNLRRALRWAAGAAAALLVLALLAMWALPHLVKQQIESRGGAAIGRELRVGSVEISPWQLALTLSDVVVGAAAADATRTPQLGIARVHVDVAARSLWRLAPVVAALEVDAPRLRLARGKAGAWDVDDVLARIAALIAEPKDEPTRFALFNVQLRDGEVKFDDQSVQRQHRLHGVHLAVPFLSNLPDDLKVKVEPRLAFKLDDSAVDLRGQALPFASDHASEISVALGEVDLGPWWAYLPLSLPLPLQPRGGALAAELSLRFAQASGQAPQLGVSGELRVRDLQLQTRAGAPMLSWRKLVVPLREVRPFDKRVALGTVRIEGAAVELRRDAAGRIDWASLTDAPAGTAPAKAAAAPAAGAPWQVQLQRVEIAGARVQASDAAVQPASRLALNAIDASADALQWPLQGELPWQLKAVLQQGGRETGSEMGSLALSGQAAIDHASVKLHAEGLQLAAFAPYLKAWLRPTVDGRALVDGELNWAAGNSPALTLALKTLQIDALRVIEPAAQRPALQAARLNVDDLKLDLLARRASVGAVRVAGAQAQLRRDAAGLLNMQQWLVAAPDRPVNAAPPTPATPAAADWRAELRDLRVDATALQFDDAGAASGTTHTVLLRGVRLAAQNLRWPNVPGNADATLSLQAALIAPAIDGVKANDGKIDLRGKFGLAPLSVRLNGTLERVAVHAFEPYFAAQLPLRLLRAELGWRGDAAIRLAPGGLAVDADGELLLADLHLRARFAGGAASDTASNPASDADELLSWRSLRAKPLRVSVAPRGKPRVEIGELALSDFYARLLVTEQGRFNLSDLQTDAASAPGATASAAASATTAASAAAATPRDLPIDLVIASTRLEGGRVDFTDHFVKPNYSAALTDLAGTIGRLASGTRDMATVDLRGRIAGTGLLDIRGAVNPTADPLALDITARASDIELAPLSPYSGKYAGFAIERGKLSVDTAYRVDASGQLQARNQIVLNQLTLGSAVASPDATKLPVRLALALLTDRNGNIDIDLPVSGSINDPQFSVFSIVLKIIGNLLVKALTSPFALLTGGGPDELSQLDCLPGTTQMAPSAAPNLARVAKALAERPALRLTLTGPADGAAERSALQRAVLQERLQGELRREQARDGLAAVPAATAEQRTLALRRLYEQTKLADKPRNLVGMLKELPAAEMEARLLASIELAPGSERELALQRAVVVRDALIAQGLPNERIFLGAPKLHAMGDSATPWSPSVQLSLGH